LVTGNSERVRTPLVTFQTGGSHLAVSPVGSTPAQSIRVLFR